MREIKFRAWDKIEKQMCPVTRVIFRQPTGYDFINVRIKWNGKIIDQGGFIGKDNTYILMQYIGAKDKNGVEIYEGDILEIGGYEEDRGVVLFNEDSTSYCVEYDNVMTPIGEFYQLELEVVGNIYENPDCLGGGSE